MQTFRINSTTLITPNGVEIPHCWEDRAEGILSPQASMALIPVMNASERLWEAYSEAFDTAVEARNDGRPDTPLPDSPKPLYEVIVDGMAAMAARVDLAGRPGPRVYVTTDTPEDILNRALG